MKQILFSAILMFGAVSASAQATATINSACQLGLNKSPSVRGVKLGMKLDEVLRLFPQSEENQSIKAALEKKDTYPNFGVIGFDIFPSDYSTRDQFRGVGVVRFTFIDDRLTNYVVEYSTPPAGPVWRRVDDWVNKVSESFALPAVANWQTDQNQNGLRILKCQGFEVHASNQNLRGNLSVSTVDRPDIEQQARREAFEEKLRRDFKP